VPTPDRKKERGIPKADARLGPPPGQRADRQKGSFSGGGKSEGKGKMSLPNEYSGMHDGKKKSRGGEGRSEYGVVIHSELENETVSVSDQSLTKTGKIALVGEVVIQKTLRKKRPLKPMVSPKRNRSEENNLVRKRGSRVVVEGEFSGRRQT